MNKDYNIYEGAKRLENVKPSPIRAIVERQNDLKKQGYAVIPFSAGEPDFNTPTDIKEQTAKALCEENLTHYAHNRGDMALRKTLAEYIKREQGLEFDPETEILVTGSGAEALNNTYLALVSEGDEVIVPTPAFVSYKTLTNLCGATFVEMPLTADNGFEIDIEQLKSLITDKTKMFIFNNPNNPSGAVYSRETLQAIADLAVEHNFIVVADEMYSKLTYDDKEFIPMASLPGMRERCVTISGFSKTFAMTGWRLGYVTADPKIISLMVRVHQYSTTCTATFIQVGAARGMMTERTDAEVEAMIGAFARRRKLLMEGLDKIDKLSYIVPYGAFYLLVDVSATGFIGQDFALKLLEEKFVATVPAIGLGSSMTNYVRISYATSDENINEGVKRLKEFVDSL